MRRTIVMVILVTIALAFVVAVAGCSQGAAAAEQKTACFANEALLRSEMALFKADSGIDAPFDSVVAKLHVVCPSGGTYSYDATTGVVTCSVHGHP